MARPRQYSDVEILTVARTCFLRDGPGVSTTVIADALGLSQAALFKRFGTKADLMMAALSPPEEPPWIDIVDCGPDDRPMKVQLIEIGVAIAEFFSEMVPCLAVMRSSGTDPVEMLSRYKVPPPLRGHIAIAAWFDRAKAQGKMRDCDSATAAVLLSGPLHSRAFMGHLLGPGVIGGDRREFIEQVIDVLWAGLQPKEGA